ncbi:MAG: hypothetical protein KC561_19810 [Myxococcales bacterium]|nr:hypothetical protein [Myxococcales bacterium]
MEDRDKTLSEPLSALAGSAPIELRRDYLQNVLHELATPLTPLIGYIKLLRSQSVGELNELQGKCVDNMHRSVTRLNRLLDDLGHLLQMASGLYSPEPLEFDFRMVIQASLAVFEPDAEAEKIELLVQLPDHPVPVVGDEAKLKYAIGHLLSNAIKFNSAGGKVFVRLLTENEGASATLEVFDSGVGIRTEDLARVFEPFFQADHSATRQFGGSGVGLTLAQWVFSMHRGELGIESPPTAQPTGHFFRGIRAFVTLPTAPPVPSE